MTIESVGYQSIGGWQKARVLIVVKTYPVPSRQHIEVSCTAGITDDGRLVRLFPIPFRLLADEQKFSKFTWVCGSIRKAKDHRPESYNLDVDSLVLDGKIDTTAKWEKRRSIVAPLVSRSVEELRELGAQYRISLGIIRPRVIEDFKLVPNKEPDWTPLELAKLRQKNLFYQAPKWTLEKLPVEFHYIFRCDDPRCNGHDMRCLDWEIGQAYRYWQNKYPAGEFQQKFLAKFRDEMILKRDTHFFMGTLAAHPITWTIIGLFYPPKITI